MDYLRRQRRTSLRDRACRQHVEEGRLVLGDAQPLQDSIAVPFFHEGSSLMLGFKNGQIADLFAIGQLAAYAIAGLFALIVWLLT